MAKSNKNFTLGAFIKSKRIERRETLHQIAMSTNIDATIISKIERGDRLPTQDQLKMLALHFIVSFDELLARLVAERIIKDYGLSQTTYQAIQIVEEELTDYMQISK